eukprot:657322-Pleurochrysis_carterae.AAC.2
MRLAHQTVHAASLTRPIELAGFALRQVGVSQKGGAAPGRKALDVFRERVVRDVSNSVPKRTSLRDEIASSARSHADFLQEAQDVRVIERIQAMLMGYDSVATGEEAAQPAFEQERCHESTFTHVSFQSCLRARVDVA